MKTISIINIKGGVGKTVTAVNTAAILAADYGLRVLLVDADPQGDSSAFFGVSAEAGGLYELMSGLVTCYDEVTQTTRTPGVDVLACDSSLFALDLAALKEGGQLGVESIEDLRDAIIEDDSYDVMLIDCPPSFTPSSVAALRASDSVVIPVKPDCFSLRGMSFLLGQLGQVQQINGRCRVAGCLVTHTHRASYISQYVDLLKQRKIPVFASAIRRCDKIDESTFACKPIREHSPRCAAARDYPAFVAELVEKEGLSNGKK